MRLEVFERAGPFASGARSTSSRSDRRAHFEYAQREPLDGRRAGGEVSALDGDACRRRGAVRVARRGDVLVARRARSPARRAAFSTRLGGVSEGPYESLNLGILTDDDPDRVAAQPRAPGRCARARRGRRRDGAAGPRRRRRRSTRSPAPSRGYATPGSELADADAQVTTSREVTPLVLVADCVPLVLPRPGVAAMCTAAGAASRRGSSSGARRDAARARRSRAAIARARSGPGSAPAATRWARRSAARFRGRGHRTTCCPATALDLALAVQRELERLGVSPRSVSPTAGSARAATPSCSSRTAATAASPAARPGSLGSAS